MVRIQEGEDEWNIRLPRTVPIGGCRSADLWKLQEAIKRIGSFLPNEARFSTLVVQKALPVILAECRALVEGYDSAAVHLEPNNRRRFEAFREDWKWLRLAMPLQVRLFVEQICYDKGWPWRSVYTGFSPIV